MPSSTTLHRVAATPPTLAVIAKEAGVSATVVSAFFKGTYDGLGGDGSRNIGIGAATQMRIISASRRLRYEPRSAALRLRIYPEKGDTCFLMPSNISDGIANPYYGRFANGVISGLHRQGRSMVVGFFDGRADYLRHQEELPSPLRDFQASRAILIGQENPSLLATLAERGCPTIYLSREVDNPHVRCFVPDFHAAPGLALAHLHALGHRRVAVLAGAYMAGIPHSYLKLLAGLNEAWPRLWPELPTPQPELVHLPLDENRLRRLLADAGGPTGVYCFDDYAARELISAAIRLGLRVPGDLSVVGTNNQLDTERHVVPLTTVNLPGEEIGEAAARTLDDMTRLLGVHMTTVDLGGEKIGAAAADFLATASVDAPEEPRVRVFPVNLVVRSSSAAPREG